MFKVTFTGKVLRDYAPRTGNTFFLTVQPDPLPGCSLRGKDELGPIQVEVSPSIELKERTVGGRFVFEAYVYNGQVEWTPEGSNRSKVIDNLRCIAIAIKRAA